MRRLAALLLGLLAAIAPASAEAPRYAGPIIDVHLHAYPQAAYQVAPLAATTTFLPPALARSLSPPSAAAHRDATLRAMRDLDITAGFVSVDVPAAGHADDLAVLRDWESHAEGRVIGGWSAGSMVRGESPAAFEAAVTAHRAGLLGELQLQYEGLGASAARLEPWFAAAERLDVPVGIHTGPGPPGAAANGAPAFRTRFGDPRLVEDMLVRHPRLRAFLMHAGWPYLAETKAMLEQFPGLYVDVSAIDWLIPRAEFRDYVLALIRAGFADRLMFGSDQMLWPQGIALAIDAINDGDWIDLPTKRAILYGNAARFFRLDGAK